MDGEKKLVFFLLGIAVVVSGLLVIDCKAKATEGKMPADTAKTVDFIDIGQGNSDWNPSRDFYGPQYLRFGSKAAWISKMNLFFFDEDHENKQNRLNEINFSEQEILIFTYGRAGTTGYFIKLDKIVMHDDTTQFYLQSRKPGPETDTGQMLGHPFDAVVIDKGAISEKLEFYIDNQKAAFETTAMNGEP